MELKNIRIGDELDLNHPNGLYAGCGYGPRTFKVVGYKNGCIIVYDCKIGGFNGMFELTEAQAKEITMVNELDKHYSSDAFLSSKRIKFSFSNIAKYRPVVKSTDLGKKIELTEDLNLDDTLFIKYSWGDNHLSSTYQIVNMAQINFEWRNKYLYSVDTSRHVYYKLDNVKMVEYTGNEYISKFDKYVTADYVDKPNKVYRLFDLNADFKENYEKLLFDTWEDEKIDKYYLIKFKQTEEFLLPRY